LFFFFFVLVVVASGGGGELSYVGRWYGHVVDSEDPYVDVKKFFSCVFVS
jgi:hypothetical protein